MELWATVVYYGLRRSCCHLKVCGYNVISMWFMVNLIMMAGAEQHADYPFIYNQYFPIQNVFIFFLPIVTV